MIGNFYGENNLCFIVFHRFFLLVCVHATACKNFSNYRHRPLFPCCSSRVQRHPVNVIRKNHNSLAMTAQIYLVSSSVVGNWISTHEIIALPLIRGLISIITTDIDPKLGAYWTRIYGDVRGVLPFLYTFTFQLFHLDVCYYRKW